MDETPARAGVRVLFAAPGFLRLWAVGGVSNAMRQFEVLAAALFTFEVTHSALAVAVVSACRNLPMLLFGALAGVVSESRDRKAILVAAQAVSGAASATVATLAWTQVLPATALPWALAVAALVSGTMWSTEGATRRRMLGETMAPELLPRGFAFDSLTNAMVRLIGPLSAGIAFQTLGLAGAYSISATFYAAAFLLALGVPHRQPPALRRVRHVGRDLAEGLRFAWNHPVISGVLGVTIVTNVFAFSYIALVAPVAERHFGVSASLVGVLAASEPVGALAAGSWLARHGPPCGGRVLMVGGSALFLTAVAVMPRMPSFGLACLAMVPGGLGTAAFSAMQTALIAAHAPAAIRSRLLGLLTVCIGSGPLGILAVGALAHWLGDRAALDVMAGTGMLAISVIGWRWRRRERAAAQVRPRSETVVTRRAPDA
jgi:MFS family permease